MSDPAIITVCALAEDPLMISDNVISRCMKCKRRVQHRPHAPAGSKICLDCVRQVLKDNPDIIPKVAREMIADYLAYQRGELK